MRRLKWLIRNLLYFFKRRKEVPKICKHCRLYNKKHSVCMVTIIDKGEQYQLEVKPEDKCHWAENDLEVNMLKVWSDGVNGFIQYEGE